MAREVVDYHAQLRKLHPRFDDCPEPCAESGEVKSDLCGGCEVRAQWEEFKESFERQYEEQRGQDDAPPEWSFATLYADVARVMNTKARLKRGYPKGCSALEAVCLDIVRAEQHRPQRIRAWELERKLERQGKHGE